MIPLIASKGHRVPGQRRSHRGRLLIGLDVGSTTAKAVCVEAASRHILWSDYQRHETRQAEKTLELLRALEAAIPEVAEDSTRLFLTGSGARPLATTLGGRFVQEVNALTLAVETLHPDVSSVVELGGQDAKVILFRENPETGEKQAICSMNDKCASGTGATIDKGLLKVGMPADQVGRLAFDPTRLHKVAAKCGVFAETDIVNLVKAGVPANEVLCSLGDAIVAQNISVLTRGNTLKPKVLLLGGPNTYLPFLRQCWRLRIPETWKERGYDFAREAPIEELVVVPDKAQYYAAYGAVVYGLDEPADVGLYRGADALEAELAAGRDRTAGKHRAPPLADDLAEVETFARRYSVPAFKPATFEPGERVAAVIGLDGGSTSSKAVLVDETGAVLAKAYRLSQGNPIEDARLLLAELRRHVAGQDAVLEVLGFGATGYAADVLEESLGADVNIVETVAHQMSAVHHFGEVDVICDIGGQDIKILFLHDGEIRDFRLSNQCSAGNGMLLQAMADQFGVPIERYADTAFRAELSPTFSYGCAVFLDADRVNFQKEGYSPEELLAGLASVLPKNVWQYVVQVPRMAELGRHFVLQGAPSTTWRRSRRRSTTSKRASPERGCTSTRTAVRRARSAPPSRPCASSRATAARPSSASTTRSVSPTPRGTTSRRAATSAPTSARAPSSIRGPRPDGPDATSPAFPASAARSSRRRHYAIWCAVARGSKSATSISSNTRRDWPFATSTAPSHCRPPVRGSTTSRCRAAFWEPCGGGRSGGASNARTAPPRSDAPSFASACRGCSTSTPRRPSSAPTSKRWVCRHGTSDSHRSPRRSSSRPAPSTAPSTPAIPRRWCRLISTICSSRSGSRSTTSSSPR